MLAKYSSINFKYSTSERTYTPFSTWCVAHNRASQYEEVRTTFPSSQHKPVPDIQLYGHDLHETADGTRLKSLVLRFMPLSDVIVLMNSLCMPLLEKLILVDLYDQSKLSQRKIKYKSFSIFH
jgi:hypothetical protein